MFLKLPNCLFSVFLIIFHIQQDTPLRPIKIISSLGYNFILLARSSIVDEEKIPILRYFSIEVYGTSHGFFFVLALLWPEHFFEILIFDNYN